MRLIDVILKLCTLRWSPTVYNSDTDTTDTNTTDTTDTDVYDRLVFQPLGTFHTLRSSRCIVVGSVSTRNRGDAPHGTVMS